MESFNQVWWRCWAGSSTAGKFLVGVMIFLGSFQYAAGQSSSITALEKQLAIAAKNKDYRKAAGYALEIASLHSDAKSFSKALLYLGRCQEYSEKAGDQTTRYTASYRSGTIYRDTKNFKKALESFSNAREAAYQTKDISRIKEAVINAAIANADLGRYKKSVEHTEEALAIAIDNNDLAFQQKCYEMLAGYHLSLGDKKKSNEYRAQLQAIERGRQLEELKLREVTELKQHIQRAGLDNLAAQSMLSAQSEKLQRAEQSLQAVEDSLRLIGDSLRLMEEISANHQLQIDLLNKDKELANMKIKEQEARIENEELLRNSIALGGGLAAALIAVLIISYYKKAKANKKIEQQNKNIKSSINYAKRIQEAMLSKRAHDGLMERSFVLFKPRDVVSGDFYWFSALKNGDNKESSDLAFAAVDCTGHGVPGAFMSMIGINSLNGIVNRGIGETNAILDALDQDIRTALRQEESGNNDGMDIALCVYRKNKRTLEFSGAKNPLVYIQNNELFQVKGDIHAIGGSKHKKGFVFKRHEIAIDKPTMIYLFSDGYRDQFGGKDNAKFMSKQFNKLLLDIHALPLQEQMERLNKIIEEWKGDREQTDDILVMGIRLEV